MSKNVPDFETRKRRRLERLGTASPICGHCGENDWRCFELHHVAGRRHDELTVLACCNCHNKLSDAQKGHPTSLAHGDPLLAAIGNFLLGLADMLALIITKLAEFGKALIERSNRVARGDGQ